MVQGYQVQPFQLLEYQWGEGRFDINKLPAPPPPCVKFMTEETSMSYPDAKDKNAAKPVKVTNAVLLNKGSILNKSFKNN